MNKSYFALAACSIDGKIALHESHFTDWTSKEDTVHLRALLSSCDAIVVGNNTYKTAYEALSKRNCIVLSRQYQEALHQEHENLVYCNPSYMDLKEYLEKSAWKSICILGGTQTYSLALSRDILTELYITIEPLIFGRGLDLFELPAVRQEQADASSRRHCTLIRCTQLNSQGSLLLHYRITKE